MDSLDGQCLLVHFADGEIPRPPDLWRHHRSGTLSCAYDGGENTFTWEARAVAEMARRWRESGQIEAPERVRLFIDTHERLESIAEDAGLGPPDVMIHDLAHGEIRGVWEQQQVVITVDEIGENVAPAT